jgi:predicted RNase H-like nuclease (RuvC/YqgF family)
MNRQDISVGQAIKEMLKGINHVVIYSGPSQQRAEIEEVIVLTKTRRRRLPPGKARRLNQQINRYNRQIDSLKQRLARVASDSRRGKRYTRQLRRIQKKIENLEKQLY